MDAHRGASAVAAAWQILEALPTCGPALIAKAGPDASPEGGGR
jgi:hypothetical protein